MGIGMQGVASTAGAQRRTLVQGRTTTTGHTPHAPCPTPHATRHTRARTSWHDSVRSHSDWRTPGGGHGGDDRSERGARGGGGQPGAAVRVHNKGPSVGQGPKGGVVPGAGHPQGVRVLQGDAWVAGEGDPHVVRVGGARGRLRPKGRCPRTQPQNPGRGGGGTEIFGPQEPEGRPRTHTPHNRTQVTIHSCMRRGGVLPTAWAQERGQ